MLLPRTPSLIGFLCKNILFRVKTSEKYVYLTFDDGPNPTATPWVLELLQTFNYKATFFLIGKNALDYPELVHKILSQHHQIGNHTLSHKNAFKTSLWEYLEDVEAGQKALESLGIHPKLFRPPYGKLTFKAFQRIKIKSRVVLWDVIAEDYSNKNSDLLLRKLINQTRPGSVIVFHDSEKSFPTLQQLLPKYLDYLKKEGYLSRAIEQDY